MSQENVEIVRWLYEQFRERKEPPWEVFAPDFEFDVSAVLPDGGSTRGRKAAEEVMGSYIGMFDDFHVAVEAVLASDDGQVVTAVRDGGTMKGTNAEVWNRFFHVFAIHDGEVTRWATFLDKGAALEAAGLSE
ncbi:MAG: nuclear transport factor 2 family protein [Solirubrobacterales bacterium]